MTNVSAINLLKKYYAFNQEIERRENDVIEPSVFSISYWSKNYAHRNAQDARRQMNEFIDKEGQSLWNAALESCIDPVTSGKAVILPSNVRTLASSLQIEGSYGNYADTAMIKVMTKTDSLNAAVDTLTGAYLQTPYSGTFQKPVSTQRNATEWQNVFTKADNTNPNVHRVGIFIRTEGHGADNQSDFRSWSLAFKKAVRRQYRFDDIIVVKPLNEAEKATGMTMKRKIKTAFDKAAQDKQQWTASSPNPNDDKFECFVHWQAHGGTESINKAKPCTPKDDCFYEEGAMNFSMGLNADDSINLSDSERKHLLQELSGYHVIEFLDACNSGAGITQATTAQNDTFAS